MAGNGSVLDSATTFNQSQDQSTVQKSLQETDNTTITPNSGSGNIKGITSITSNDKTKIVINGDLLVSGDVSLNSLTFG